MFERNSWQEQRKKNWLGHVKILMYILTQMAVIKTFSRYLNTYQIFNVFNLFISSRQFMYYIWEFVYDYFSFVIRSCFEKICLSWRKFNYVFLYNMTFFLACIYIYTYIYIYIYIYFLACIYIYIYLYRLTSHTTKSVTALRK